MSGAPERFSPLIRSRVVQGAGGLREGANEQANERARRKERAASERASQKVTSERNRRSERIRAHGLCATSERTSERVFDPSTTCRKKLKN